MGDPVGVTLFLVVPLGTTVWVYPPAWSSVNGCAFITELSCLRQPIFDSDFMWARIRVRVYVCMCACTRTRARIIHARVHVHMHAIAHTCARTQ